MKIIAINGSPRKGWNSDRLLLSWIDGVKSVCNDANIKVVNLYDLTFTGCRSCFACKLKDGKFFGTSCRRTSRTGWSQAYHDLGR
jgi:multimeric flavodoxin WrbA